MGRVMCRRVCELTVIFRRFVPCGHNRHLAFDLGRAPVGFRPTILMRFGLAMAMGLSAFASSVGAEEKRDANEAAETSSLSSLLDTAPGAFTTALRYPKFYSDKNMNRDTVDGLLRDRQYLLGSLRGALCVGSY